MVIRLVALLVMAAAMATPTVLWVQVKATRERELRRLAEMVSGWVAVEVNTPGRATGDISVVPAATLESAVAGLLRPLAPPRAPAPTARFHAA